MYITSARTQSKVDRGDKVHTCSSQAGSQFYSAALAKPLKIFLGQSLWRVEQTCLSLNVLNSIPALCMTIHLLPCGLYVFPCIIASKSTQIKYVFIFIVCSGQFMLAPLCNEGPISVIIAGFLFFGLLLHICACHVYCCCAIFACKFSANKESFTNDILTSQ